MKFYYEPNGGISFLPDIQGFGEIKVFGCQNPSNYADGAILFTNTPNAPAVMAQEVKAFQPDFVFIETFNVEMVDALRRIRRFYHKPIIGFWGDCVLDTSMIDILARAGKYCNIVYVVDKPAEMALLDRGITAQFTLQPASESRYRYEPGVESEYDIVLAGNPYSTNTMPNAQQRIELAQILSKKFNLTVFGSDDWKKYGINSKGWVNEYKLAKIYNRSKIIVTCDSVIDKKYFTSVRTYNVLCSCTFLLIRKFLGIEDLFENKKHLVWFEHNEEAVELLDYYLKHDNERREIANFGMNYVKNNALKRELFYRWSRADYDQVGKIPIKDQILDSLWLLRRFKQSRP